MVEKKSKIKLYFYGIIILLAITILVFALVSESIKKEDEEKVDSRETNLESLKESALDEVKEFFWEEDVREPAVAGSFYPHIQLELEKKVEEFLENTQDSPELGGEILAMVVPHAGYDFSGQVQAYAYQQLKGKKIRTVILIGPSHYESFDGVSIYPSGYYKTPLGKVKIDALLARKIIEENDRIAFHPRVHEKEHSLEVQIPFIQKVLPQAQIIPIIIGNQSNQNVNILAQAILKHLSSDSLIVASSDLSHYPPYDLAQEVDQEVINAILSQDPNGLDNKLRELENSHAEVETFLCGESAVKTIMLIVQLLGADEAKLLKYYNSGDLEKGNKEKVVGYSSLVFTAPQRYGAYNLAEREALLKIARTSVEYYVRSGQLAAFEVGSDHLKELRGAFVTIRKDGELRGCVGHFDYDKPLTQVVQEMAIAAATQDQRFQPVAEEELEELDYEVSILSPMEKINNPNDIVLGRHGVMIKRGEKSGLFLPQVAEETGWDFATFMNQLCTQKVGLELNCWQDDNTGVYIFRAEVFKEGD